MLRIVEDLEPVAVDDAVVDLRQIVAEPGQHAVHRVDVLDPLGEIVVHRPQEQIVEVGDALARGVVQQAEALDVPREIAARVDLVEHRLRILVLPDAVVAVDGAVPLGGGGAVVALEQELADGGLLVEARGGQIPGLAQLGAALLQDAAELVAPAGALRLALVQRFKTVFGQFVVRLFAHELDFVFAAELLRRFGCDGQLLFVHITVPPDVLS